MSSLTIYFITGLSGAGKSQAIQTFEDMGFYCVDNLPSALVNSFLEYCDKHQREFEGVALVLDVRENGFVEDFPDLVTELRTHSSELKILFLEASLNVLLNRYKESRRPHPLGEAYSLKEAIEAERERLSPIREKADLVIDTSRMTTHQFRGMLTDLHDPDDQAQFTISLTSFGFKHGIPAHVDALFDARFLPNPYYETDLKELAGNESDVKTFFENHESVERYLDQLKSLLDVMVEEYSSEGKELISIGVGCTGGRHRSVYLITRLAEYFHKKDFTRSIVTHRDLDVSGDQGLEND